MDLEKFKENSEDQGKNYLHDFVLIESAIKKDGNISYYELADTWRSGKRHLRIITRSFIKNGKAYTVGFTAGAETYDSYKKVAEEIINSFRLTQ